MGEITKIAWAHSTFNPWIGCTKIGPGCDNCYASANDVRFTGGRRWGAGAPRHRTAPSNWRQPIIWERKAQASGEPWRVFCASQADVFDNEVPQEWREDLFELIRCTSNLTWLLLTKRIGNVADMLPKDWGDGYPNVWLGITVVTQDEFLRDVPKLQRIPARIKWLSIEPQIENVVIPVYRHYPFHWVVCGGESRQFGKCRPFNIAWAKTLRLGCERECIPFFMKQLGHQAVDYVGDTVQTAPYQGYTGKGDDPTEWPEYLRVREFPA